MSDPLKKIRFVCPFHSIGDSLIVGNYHFSPHIPLDEADALLCDWAPSPELLSFSRPKAWYCCEPLTRYPGYRQQNWQAVLQRLPPSCAFNHLQPSPACRVPHFTHWLKKLPMWNNPDRLPRAVAVISNPGFERVFRSADTRLRLAFATHRSVDLFGNRERWSHFRRIPLLTRHGPPANFRGEVEGAWGQQPKIRLLSSYRVCVCLENTCEPFYFTEKFVDAAQAGCIPIYHAHPTVKRGVLKSARWVDPESFGFSSDRTLAFALNADPRDYQEANAAWLASEAFQATRKDRVYTAIADRLFQSPSAPPLPPVETEFAGVMRKAFSRLRLGALLPAEARI